MHTEVGSFEAHPVFTDPDHSFVKHLKDNVAGFITPRRQRAAGLLAKIALTLIVFAVLMFGLFVKWPDSDVVRYCLATSMATILVCTAVLLLFDAVGSVRFEKVIQDLEKNGVIGQGDYDVLNNMDQLRGRARTLIAERRLQVIEINQKAGPFDPTREKAERNFKELIEVLARWRILPAEETVVLRYFPGQEKK